MIAGAAIHRNARRTQPLHAIEEAGVVREGRKRQVEDVARDDDEVDALLDCRVYHAAESLGNGGRHTTSPRIRIAAQAQKRRPQVEVCRMHKCYCLIHAISLARFPQGKAHCCREVETIRRPTGALIVAATHDADVGGSAGATS